MTMEKPKEPTVKSEPSEFEKFENLARHVVSVPLSKIKRAEQKKRKSKKRKPKK